MNAKRRQHFVRRLEAERERLADVIRELESEAAVDVIEAAAEPDRSREPGSDAELAEAEASLELKQLREIDAALLRLRERPLRFGRCVVCGEQIGRSRLDLVPWTQRCADHAPTQGAAARSEVALAASESPVMD